MMNRNVFFADAGRARVLPADQRDGHLRDGGRDEEEETRGTGGRGRIAVVQLHELGTTTVGGQRQRPQAGGRGQLHEPGIQRVAVPLREREERAGQGRDGERMRPVRPPEARCRGERGGRRREGRLHDHGAGERRPDGRGGQAEPVPRLPAHVPGRRWPRPAARGHVEAHHEPGAGREVGQHTQPERAAVQAGDAAAAGRGQEQEPVPGGRAAQEVQLSGLGAVRGGRRGAAVRGGPVGPRRSVRPHVVGREHDQPDRQVRRAAAGRRRGPGRRCRGRGRRGCGPPLPADRRRAGAHPPVVQRAVQEQPRFVQLERLGRVHRVAALPGRRLRRVRAAADHGHVHDAAQAHDGRDRRARHLRARLAAQAVQVHRPAQGAQLPVPEVRRTDEVVVRRCRGARVLEKRQR